MRNKNTQRKKQNLSTSPERSKYLNRMEFKTTLPKDAEDVYNLVSTAGLTLAPFFGTSDNFPQLLYDVSEQSPTKAACVFSKTNLCLGNGFLVLDKMTDLPAPENTLFEVKQILADKTLNANRNDFFSVCKTMFEEWFTVGNIVIVLQRMTIGSKRVLKYSLHPVKHVRVTVQKQSSDERLIVISPLFELGYASSYVGANFLTCSEYPKWSRGEKGIEQTAIYIPNLLPGRGTYGLPQSVSSIYHQITEAEVQRFNLEETTQKWLPNVFIEAVEPAVSNPQELNRIYDMLAQAYTNEVVGNETVKKRRFVYREVGDKDQFTKITELGKTLDFQYFAELSRENERKILISEMWHKSLVGVHDENGIIGNTKERVEAYKTAYASIIAPARKKVSSILNSILKEYYLWVYGKEINFYVDFQDNRRYILGDEVVQRYMTVNEVRILNGLPALSTEIGELLTTQIPKAVIPHKNPDE